MELLEIKNTVIKIPKSLNVFNRLITDEKKINEILTPY